MTDPQTIIYSPESSLRHPRRLARAMVRDLLASHGLAWRLAVRDLSAQYRQAALGFLWAFILPLAHTAAWLFLDSAGVVHVGDTGLPYALYVFSGTMLWSIFMDALGAPLQQTTAAKPMLAKVSFPREALVVAGLYQTFFNAGIKVVLILAVLLAFGRVPGGSLLLLPLGIASLILAGTALGLLVTPLGLLYTDVGKSLPLLAQFLMYLTPVVFPVPEAGWAARVMQLNPMTPLIETTRAWLTGLDANAVLYFLSVNAFLVGLLIVVWVVYRAAMPILIERMSA